MHACTLYVGMGCMGIYIYIYIYTYMYVCYVM